MKYTKLSDFIKELEDIYKKNGDMPVCAAGDHGWVANVYPEVMPHYYDGSYYIQDGIGTNGSPNFAKGRNLVSISKDPNLQSVIKLKCFYFDENTNFNGRPIREINPGDWVWLDEMEHEQKMKFGGEVPKFRGLKYFNQQMQCYPIEAYLSNGLFAEGRSAKDAEDNLAKKFLLKDPNLLMKEKL